MTYAGLKITDKPALLDAKENGAEWIARDANFVVYGFVSEPVKSRMGWKEKDKYGAVYAGTGDTLPFVKTMSDKPYNIDLALAQIAEMERAEKPNEKCPICEYAISGCQCLYSGSAHPDRHDKRRVVLDHLYMLSTEQVKHIISLEKHWQISYADEMLNTILKKLIANSPYAEGEKV